VFKQLDVSQVEEEVEKPVLMRDNERQRLPTGGIDLMPLPLRQSLNLTNARGLLMAEYKRKSGRRKCESI
jgi:hypothetical protein